MCNQPSRPTKISYSHKKEFLTENVNSSNIFIFCNNVYLSRLAKFSFKMTSKYEKVATPVVNEAVAVPIVTITSPANLDEGFVFEAEYDGESFPVVVPKGGVVKGQAFEVDFIKNDEVSPTSGKWKDGLFDCCAFGPCHASFLMALCCPIILTGQVMTRLNLNMWGLPGTPQEVRNTFRVLLIIAILYEFRRISFFVPGVFSHGSDEDEAVAFIRSLFDIFMAVFLIVLWYRTRKATRERDNIPNDTCCGVTNDCCIPFWCTCCAVSQMARHTTDYNMNSAMLCSTTGVRTPSPVMIV